ncbi:hypothetical protein HMPREF9281_02331 [Staphylococcus epidermidis BVS058A4]|nr:hypothetical protein HMPREF9281_02331 [Staphylococcus epidermidis BVS058A4]
MSNVPDEDILKPDDSIVNCDSVEIVKTDDCIGY